MANVQVNISFNDQFGTQGSGNKQFEYPSGICVISTNIYVCDKQNHRIQKFDLFGTFILEFGSYGTGNDNFAFPEGICTDGINLFIVDSANHRIKEHTELGIFVSEFGSLGSAKNQFNYPMDIEYDDAKLYIVDKQNHRVMIYDTSATVLREIGSYGTSDAEFNFPEGVDILADRMVVADSGNKVVKYFDLLGGFLYKTNIAFDYPTDVATSDGIITVIDRQANALYFFDDVGNYISMFGSVGSGDNEFFFPYSAMFDDDLLYITDSANHRVKIFDFTVLADIPTYTDLFTRISKQLYPTGRAWWMKKDSTFEKLHAGLAMSESRLYEVSRDLLNSILPDNNSFDETDATNWEEALGLYIQPYLNLEERKAIILRKMVHPGNIPARQHYLYLEGQLQNAGFNVYVHENRFGDPPTVINPVPPIYGQVNYGQVNYGDSIDYDFTKLANHVVESMDEDFKFGPDMNLRATFFIGDEIFGDRADVDSQRKNEFRNLILTIKPAHTAAFLLIDYI